MNLAAGAPPAPAHVGSTPERERREEISRRLVWLAAFRVGAVTALLGTTALLAFKGDEPLGGRVTLWLSALATFTNLLQIVVVVLLKLQRGVQTLAAAQILGDVVFATMLVYLTGGGDSLFSFMYLIAVVNGSILLSGRGAWMAAVASTLAHSLIVVSLERGWLLAFDASVAQARMGVAQLAQTLLTHGTSFALTAVLGAYVAGQLRREGERAAVAESSLSQLAALHDAIVRSIASGIVTSDEGGRITFLNRAGEEILGRRSEEVAGRPLTELFPGLSLDSDGRPRSSASENRAELQLRTEAGSPRTLGVTVTRLLDQRGRIIGASGVFQDLTRIRELEALAARAEKLAALGSLSAGLAHELRNPLAAISGSVELLAGGPERAPDEQRLLGIVQREAARLDGLVTDFLAFARPAAAVPIPIDLASIAREVLDVFAADPRAAQVVRHVQLASARALVDPSQLKQVLWNLLTNAVEACDGRGTIWIESARTAAGDEVWLSVADDGPGVPPSERSKIFEPFHTTKPRGTGLGLATVHRIVDGHGGRIVASERPGGGALFTIHLPAEGEG